MARRILSYARPPRDAETFSPQGEPQRAPVVVSVALCCGVLLVLLVALVVLIGLLGVCLSLAPPDRVWRVWAFFGVPIGLCGAYGVRVVRDLSRALHDPGPRNAGDTLEPDASDDSF